MTKENQIAKKAWKNHVSTVKRNMKMSKDSIEFFKKKILHYQKNIAEELVEIELDKKDISRSMEIIKGIK